MLVQSICNKNQSREKLKTKNILWRSSYKICNIFADFWAISCIFRPTKKIFETYLGYISIFIINIGTVHETGTECRYVSEKLSKMLEISIADLLVCLKDACMVKI